MYTKCERLNTHTSTSTLLRTPCPQFRSGSTPRSGGHSTLCWAHPSTPAAAGPRHEAIEHQQKKVRNSRVDKKAGPAILIIWPIHFRNLQKTA